MVVTLGGNMIPAYPTSTDVRVLLNGQHYPLSQVDFIMWLDTDEVYSSEDAEATYDSFVAANEWRVVLTDDSVITVLQSSLDSDTREHLINLAFPD